MIFAVGSTSGRLTMLLGLCLMLVLVVGLVAVTAPPAHAQEDKSGDNAAEAAKAPAPDAASRKTRSLFWHLVYSAGPVFGPLLLAISIALVALIVLLIMDLRMSVAIPPGFVEDFTDTVNKRRFKEAFEMTRTDNSFLARVLTAGMGRLQYGIDDAREAAFNMVDSIRASKDQLITYLATIGTLGPMIGLVGTVFGMILAFMELASGTTPRTDKLADAISSALVITLIGIGISVPAIFCHALFRNRLIRMSMDTGNIADDLLTQMYHNSKRPAGATPTPPPTADPRAATAAAAVKPA
ncbi:MAG TPA: MotA/TolQ/ExbB proton channel family protein [Gemmataceae bacterium]|nr:MotA/TolQ/ExbB proton channel family protein [Gemmataceae bacterium]